MTMQERVEKLMRMRAIERERLAEKRRVDRAKKRRDYNREWKRRNGKKRWIFEDGIQWNFDEHGNRCRAVGS